MDQPSFLEHRKGVEQLRGEYLYQLRAKALELILFDELVQVG